MIKAIVKDEDEKQELKFPCLMKSVEDESIFLVTDALDDYYYKGIALATPEGFSVGKYIYWRKSKYVPFCGTVELSNV